MTGVTVLPNLVKKKGNYSIEDVEMSEAEFVKQVNEMDDMTLAMANINVQNDAVMNNRLGIRQDNAIRDSQVDVKVKDVEDRKTLIEKSKELEAAEKDAEKKGAYAVPGADLKVEKIKGEIQAVIDKYADVDARTKEVRSRAKIKA